jgi:hypothetical protein
MSIKRTKVGLYGVSGLHSNLHRFWMDAARWTRTATDARANHVIGRRHGWAPYKSSVPVSFSELTPRRFGVSII